MSFKGCERCKVIVEKSNDVTVFLKTNAEKKTNKEFRSGADEDYHNGYSIFNEMIPPVNMLSKYVICL